MTKKLCINCFFQDLHILHHFLDKPSAPQDLSAISVDETTIRLKWREPMNNGGAEITNYVVQKREASRQSYKPVDSTDEQEMTVANLSEGVKYIFSVAAENQCGVGQAAELSQAIEAKSPHGAYSVRNQKILISVNFNLEIYDFPNVMIKIMQN